jgi:hypothetical protein
MGKHLTRSVVAGFLTAASPIACSPADAGPLNPGIDASAVDTGWSLAMPVANGPVCPVGLALDDAGCPSSLPASGSCCSQQGLVCDYLEMDGGPGYGTTHTYARCSQPHSSPDGAVGTWWSTGTAVDRDWCGATTDAGQLLDPGDAGACAERPLVPCDLVATQTPQEALNWMLSELAGACGFSPCTLALQVDFVDGCATDVTFEPTVFAVGDGGLAVGDELAQCLSAGLTPSRWACAGGLSCAVVPINPACNMR